MSSDGYVHDWLMGGDECCLKIMFLSKKVYDLSVVIIFGDLQHRNFHKIVTLHGFIDCNLGNRSLNEIDKIQKLTLENHLKNFIKDFLDED